MARIFPKFPSFPKGRFQVDRRWNMIFFRIPNLLFFDFVLAFFPSCGRRSPEWKRGTDDQVVANGPAGSHISSGSPRTRPAFPSPALSSIRETRHSASAKASGPSPSAPSPEPWAGCPAGRSLWEGHGRVAGGGKLQEYPESRCADWDGWECGRDGYIEKHENRFADMEKGKQKVKIQRDKRPDKKSRRILRPLFRLRGPWGDGREGRGILQRSVAGLLSESASACIGPP